MGIFLMSVLYIALLAITIVGMWKVFEKAGQPGWAAIVPVYNLIVLMKIVDRPIWWFVLCLIPYAGVVFFVIVSIDLAKKFGKTAGYGVGLGLLPFVFFPMLAFSDAKYQDAK